MLKGRYLERELELEEKDEKIMELENLIHVTRQRNKENTTEQHADPISIKECERGSGKLFDHLKMKQSI